VSTMIDIITEHRKHAFFSEDEYNLVSSLITIGQAHLFSDWDPVGTNDALKKQLLVALEKVHNTYPGGIIEYIKRAKQLLDDSKDGINTFSGFVPEHPEVVDLSGLDATFLEMENIGLQHAHELAIIMVAGGLGERLGYPGIKIDIPVDAVQKRTYLQLCIEYIKALQERYFGATDKNVDIPFIIMTSGDTHQKTIACLDGHHFYGLKPDQVILLKQDLVPALHDNKAHIVLERPYEMLLKPHGHGDIHTLVYQNKVIDRLIDSGVKQLAFIQDTNAHAVNAILPCIGASVTHGFGFNFAAIPRVPKEAIGAITKLVGKEKSVTVNIEYNQLDALLRETVNKEGDVPDEHGLSIFPGNPNIFLIDTELYSRILRETKGVTPEFINPKYTDETKTEFAKPARIETLMQDIPKLFEASDQVGTTVLDRKWCFSPNKNSVAAASIKEEANIPCESATTAESDYYLINRKKLAFGNMEFEQGDVEHYFGVPYLHGARVILYPDFCLTIEDIKRKVEGGHCSKDSTLILNGEDIIIRNLVLKGNSGLIVNVCKNARVEINDLTIDNDGFELKQLTRQEMDDPSVPEYLKIRGYKITPVDPLVYDITEAGAYEIGAEGKLVTRGS
jgi:UDP-sugar pyrophosphorylase